MNREIEKNKGEERINERATKGKVMKGGWPHMNHWGLPADHLRHHVGYEGGIFPKLLVFLRILIQRDHAATDAVAGGVVAAHDEQDDVA